MFSFFLTLVEGGEGVVFWFHFFGFEEFQNLKYDVLSYHQRNHQ